MRKISEIKKAKGEKFKMNEKEIKDKEVLKPKQIHSWTKSFGIKLKKEH